MALRVLFFVTDLKIGGTPRVVRDLSIRLRCEQMDTAVACLTPWGPVADELKSAGIPVHAFGVTRPWQFLNAVKKLGVLAKDFDVVFSFLMHANAVAAATSRNVSATRWIQSIQTTQPNPRWHWRVQGWAARRAEAIVVPTRSIVSVAHARSKIPIDRFRVIPNAIDVESFSAIERKPAGVSFRAGFIGRLDPVKRIEDLISAVASIDDVELNIFGGGPEHDALARLIASRKLDNRVRLRGGVPSSHAALSELDVLILPSDAEGFGLVLIEAMAAGVPIVATDVPGIRDVVTHDVTGLLVPPRSPTQLAQAIQRIRSDSVLREGLIAAGKKCVADTYQWDQVLPLYRSVLRGEKL